MPYLFEWDSRKAVANLRKHRVTFEDATTAFADPLGLLRDDPAHSLDEARFLLLASSRAGKLLVIAFAERAPRTRIISARHATRLERRQYENEH